MPTNQLHKRIIDGVTYEIEMMSVSESLKMLTRLTKIVGEPIAIIATVAMKEDGSDLNDRDEVDLISKAVRELVSRLDEKEVLDMVQTLCQSALCNGAKINFEVQFRGKLGHMFKLLMAVVEVQYKDFLSGKDGGSVFSLAGLKSMAASSRGTTESGDQSSKGTDD